MNKQDIIQAVKNAGVIGAGGAGFPTHIKLNSTVEYFIANGAECEPLIRANQELMHKEARDIVRGLNIAIQSTSAKKGIIAIKGKHKEIINIFERLCSGTKSLEVFSLKNVYPAGDEFDLVYEITRRITPEAGIPLHKGVAVNNVETLYNITKAIKGEPVIEKYLTVTGAVRNPATFKLPIGTSIQDAIDLAGGITIQDFAIMDSGIMMGKLLSINETRDGDNFHSEHSELLQPITKTTSGIIVLPKSNPLIINKSQPIQQMQRRAKTECVQCSLCTESCPRYLIGHSLHPHRIMNTFGYGGIDLSDVSSNIFKEALICSECGVCEFVCPFRLSPKRVNIELKKRLWENKIKWQSNPDKIYQPNPAKEMRAISVSKILSRYELNSYDVPAPYKEISFTPHQVVILLKQGVGIPSQPIVKVGQKVEKGELIADVPDNAVGSKMHSSISGTVVDINKDSITISSQVSKTYINAS